MDFPNPNYLEIYDRHIRLLGVESIKKLSESTVLIVGMSGTGVEIASKLVLIGLGKIFLCDDSPLTSDDLRSTIYFSEGDLGRNRVESCISELKQLNSSVEIFQVSREKVNKDFLMDINVVCFTNEPIFSLVDMNHLCRETETSFVACESRGVFGSVFFDYGRTYVTDDINGEPVEEDLVVDITRSNPAIVTVNDERYLLNLSSGDKVCFRNVLGMTEINELSEPVEIRRYEKDEVTNWKYSFEIDLDTSKFSEYDVSGYVKKVNQQVSFSFKRLDEAAEDLDLVLEYDYSNFQVGRNQHHPIFRSMNDFYKLKNRYPVPFNQDDSDTFLELVKKYNSSADENMVRIFSQTCMGNLSITAGILSGIVSFEIIKAVTNKFSPLRQFFYFDSIKSLPQNFGMGSLENEEEKRKNQILDEKRISSQKVLLVGIGSIGNEILKQLVLLGYGNNSCDGEIIICDNEVVRVYNLPLQSLFRINHIGKLKVECAKETISKFNLDLNIRIEAIPIEKETFGDQFWESLDLVICSTDNTSSRMFLDQKCLHFQKPIIVLGQNGGKSNSQVVLPFITESYSDHKDPVESEFHSFRNFPYKLEHCVLSAKDAFRFLFRDDILSLYLENPSDYFNSRINKVIEKFEQTNNETEAWNVFETIKFDSALEMLLVDKIPPKDFSDCLELALWKLKKKHCDHPRFLLNNWPRDQIYTYNNTKFWSGYKIPPVEIDWDDEAILPLIILYIKSVSKICALAFQIEYDENDINWEKEVSELILKRNLIFKPRYENQEKIRTLIEYLDNFGLERRHDDPYLRDKNQEDIDQDLEDTLLKQLSFNKDITELKNLCNLVVSSSTITSSENIKFREEEIKKIENNPSSSIIYNDFIFSSSNFKALNYNIPIGSRFEVLGYSKKITPRIISSSSVISGLSCFEILKLIGEKKNYNNNQKIDEYGLRLPKIEYRKIEDYCNIFVNLLLPIFISSEPAPKKKIPLESPENDNNNNNNNNNNKKNIFFSSWDFVEMDFGEDIKLNKFLQRFREKYNMVISLLVNSNLMIYANYMPNDENENGEKKIIEICRDMGWEEVEGKDYILLTVLLEDPDNDEIEYDGFPNIKYKYRNF